MYNRVGASYDATRRADPCIAGQLAGHLSLSEDGMYLDFACSTGNYSIAPSNRAGRWVGVDIAGRMVDQARQKTLGVHWSLGAVEGLPVKDRTFSGAIFVLALHHFAELGPIFREVCRVLHQGKFVIFTADPDQMRGYWLNAYFPEAMRKSIEQMPTLDQVSESLLRAGLGSIESAGYEVRDDLQDLFLYSGKHRPQLYLDHVIRSGISTFNNQARREEVRQGCERLAKDIESGRVSDIVDLYRNPLGDYMFIAGSNNPQKASGQ